MNLKLLPTFLLALILFIRFVKTAPTDDNDDKTWWKTSNYYQIYPKSFQDSDGNGVGDLNGITERLGYLKEIGIKATWLSPIFKSPMVDNGYDISDFREIDPTFGTKKDFDNLVTSAHKLGIKVILDFVPNHSSDQHEWFKNSVDRIPGYEDFYVWHDGIKNDEDPTKNLPPNNWRSVFRGSAWTWNEKRKQYYYHQFYKQQPDLNFRSEKVKEEMKSILTYWLDQGVDGFRIDAVPHIFEDKQFRNEEKIPDVDPEDYNSLIHNYTYDQNETFGIIYEWRKVLDEYSAAKPGVDRILLAEAYSPMDKKIKYYGNGTHKGAQFPFNFFLLELTVNSTANEYVAKVKEWMDKMPEGETANWVLGNHDNPRVANRLGRKKTNLINLFMLSLPGITVTYYGEEIGMENIELPKPFYMEDKRDGERSPMQWSDGISAGFSTNETTWLPVAPDYKYRNVKLQRRNPLSNLNQFKTMVTLREKYNFYENSKFWISSTSTSVINVTRSDIELLFNVGTKVEKVNQSGRQHSEVLFMNEHSKRRIGDKISVTKYDIHPNEVLVLKRVGYN